MSTELPFTGERFVPGVGGNIFLEHMHRYFLAAAFVAGKDVLDIASGEGFGSSILAQQARSVVGVDIDTQSVQHAVGKYATETLRFQQGSATDIPMADGSVDVVVSFETIEHIVEHERMLAEVKRVLRPGGVLIMSTPDKAIYTDASTHVNPFHVRELYRADFDKLLRSQFAHVLMHGQKVGFGSIIAPEHAGAVFHETDSASMQTVGGLADALYLIGVASDDPAAIHGMSGLFKQEMQGSDPVLRRVEYEMERVSQFLVTEFNWMSTEIDRIVQRGSWFQRASFRAVMARMASVGMLYAIAKLPGLSKRRRAKLLRSAEKRDPALVVQKLADFRSEFESRVAQNRFITESARRKLVQKGIKITAVVPNYNHARFLSERLDSIINQTYPLIDILVLDDCSNDDSRQVIAEYAARYPSRIRFIFNETNSGNVFRQWRKGYEEATGDLIWFCESDDFCDRNFAERLVAHFTDPSVMLAFGRVEFVDGAGNHMPGMEQYLESAEAGAWGKSRVMPAASWFNGAFGVKNLIANVGGSIWRRVPLADAVWDEAATYRVMGDWFLYAALVRGGQIAFEPGALASFRIHGQNTSGSAAMATPGYYREYARLMTSIKRRWPVPQATIARFAAQCESVFKASGQTGVAFQDLMPLAEIEAVQPEFPHVLMGMLGFSYGGGEIFPIHLANALHRRGVPVSMLQLMDRDDHPEVRAMLDPGIPVYKAATVRERGGKAFIDAAGISIVHSHMASVEMMMLDELKVDLPYLSTLHGSYEAMDLAKQQIADWAARVDAFGYTAERNLSAFADISVPQAKFRKLRNAMPVDARPWTRSRASLGIAENAVVFTFVARGIEGKGWIEAIRAFKELRRRRPERPVALIAVGEGTMTTAARAVAGDDPSIHFVGFDSAIHGIYRISDVALVPTRFSGESFPLCLIQAMQVGVPSIATDIGEIASMVRTVELTGGVLVPNLDDDTAFVAAVVDAMEAVLDDGLRGRLAQDAALLGAAYSIDDLAADYLTFYRNVIMTRQGTRKR